MMPEIDGYGVLYLLNKILRPLIFRLFYYCKIRTIGYAKRNGNGADDYLTKPFGRLELLNAIETRLKRKEEMHNYYSQSLDKLDNLVAKKVA
jgi:DNA-binding response OmpR family regulator